MFLKELWIKDRIMALVLSGVILIYLSLHIVKLEVFPLYLFPMYSLPKEAGKEQVVYVLKDNKGAKVDCSDMSYRRFTYLSNTLKAYDEILSSDKSQPNIVVVDKFIDRLKLDGTSFGNALDGQYRVNDIEYKIQRWLSHFLEEDGPFIVERCQYKWKTGNLDKNKCKTLSL